METSTPALEPIETTRDGVEYVIRWYEPGDGAGFCDLLEATSGVERDVTWFERLYVDNPYLDHVPLVVAEAAGDIVGTRPFAPYRVRVGGSIELALLTRDTVVHPDHRRRGLFTTMTERALQRYVVGEPAFAFSHSNANSRPGYRNMGWRYIGTREKFYRFHDPRPFVVSRTRDSVGRVLAPTAAAIARGYLRFRAMRTSSPTDVTVERRSGVPADLLASLYDRRPPEAIHPVRDAAFYRWRFSVPGRETSRTYVATHDGEHAAAMVVRGNRGETSWLIVEDVVPMVGGSGWRRGLDAILGRLLADHADAELVVVTGSTVPRDLLKEHGFVSGEAFPLSPFVDYPLQLGVRSLAGDGDDAIDERSFDAAAPYLWSVS